MIFFLEILSGWWILDGWWGDGIFCMKDGVIDHFISYFKESLDLWKVFKLLYFEYIIRKLSRKYTQTSLGKWNKEKWEKMTVSDSHLFSVQTGPSRPLSKPKLSDYWNWQHDRELTCSCFPWEKWKQNTIDRARHTASYFCVISMGFPKVWAAA